jgi:L-aminopeptidase/D-esterase-like protein
MKSGLGTWSERRDEVLVGSLAVVNAFGDVRDRAGGILAGARSDEGFLDSRVYLADGGEPCGSFATQGVNTTLVVVATNVALSQLELGCLAEMATDSLAQRITPVGTMYDGDLVFAVSTDEVPLELPVSVEMLAQDATAVAVERAVSLAVGTEAIPGLAGPTYHADRLPT